MKLEACIETIEEAQVASKYKLNRVELCSALDLGGLTPSMGLINKVSSIIETHVLIRPRPGNFVYSEDEVQLMINDIEACAANNAKGVVIGCLDENDDISVDSITLLFNKARQLGLDCTFHRAFDFCQNHESSLELLVQLGFDRVLTSGGSPTAQEGSARIKNLVNQAKGRIEIMAGSGVKSSNILDLMDSGIGAAHFSIRRKQADQIGFNMGIQYEPVIFKIKSILNVLGR